MDGRRDVGEVLEELGAHVLVGRGAVLAQDQGDLEHVEAEQRHPARRVGLLEPALDGERRRAVDRADVVQAEEAALEDVVAVGVLAVDPPGEVQEQLVEDALEEDEVGGAVDGEHPQGGPGVDGRVHVAEGPLVGGQLAVGVHVPLAAQQQELLLGELRIDVGDGHALEGQVPRREPRVLPRVAAP